MSFGSFEPSSGQRWSLRQAVVVARHLLDEALEEEEVGGNQEECSSPKEEEREISQSPADWSPSCLKLASIRQLVEDFHIRPAFTIYVPSPLVAPILSPPPQLLKLLLFPFEVRPSLPYPSVLCTCCLFFSGSFKSTSPQLLSGFSWFMTPL